MTEPRGELGQLIRDARKRHRHSQHHIAVMLGFSQSKMNKIEAGRTRIDPGDLHRLIDCLEVEPEAAAQWWELLAQAQEQRLAINARPLIPAYFKRFLTFERVAVRIRGWHSEEIPGPLQGEAHMIAMFPLDHDHPRPSVFPQIRNRLQRREMFAKNPKSRYEYLIGEGAFHRIEQAHRVAVALDQVESLIHLQDEFPNVAVRILPFQATATVPVSFTLLDMPGKAPDVAYVEHVGAALYLNRKPEIARYEVQWEFLSARALDRRGSLEFLAKWRERLHGALPPEGRI
ncbi:helix-turn-helix transcriptional regulator [Actinokineospora sp. NBRC 105648]|uniref:helix-turn-helix domain-containing protein n=1 Tax=Actinokineospora sp. NBRC 105648 TaxID=3032206 RepID=UPI0024A06F3B|nr:helix-turn-helix transcriptional regulator [Actinokineospora sp. NBRC 105648]GLZ41962.1 transcriptional regulator [Actinokineospora sp. NBRC 105648]